MNFDFPVVANEAELTAVCTKNPIHVDDLTESPQLAE
jgi:hypothetical protein